MENKINGNITGIRDSVLEEMKELFDMTQPSGMFLTRDLSEKLAVLTEKIGREISVYLSRGDQR